MALTAGTVIDDARDQHPAFGPEDNPPGVLYRFLTRYQQQLAGKVLEIRPSFFPLVESAVLTIPTDEPSFDGGISVPGTIWYVREAYAQRGDDAFQTGKDWITLLQLGSRRGAHQFPSAVIDGTGASTRIKLLGRPEDYAVYSGIVVRSVAFPADITGNASTFALPDDCRSALADTLASFMAERVAALGAPVNTDDFEQDAKDSEQQFLDRVAKQFSAETSRIAEVW